MSEMEQTLVSGKSHYNSTELRKMIGDNKKEVKEEHTDVERRVKTARSDMAD